MADPDSEFQAKFEALRQSYVGRLDERLSELEAHANALSGGGGTDTLEAIVAATHKLAGNAPTFGFPELGAAAQAIEQDGEAMMAAGGDPAPDDRARIADSVAALRRYLDEREG